MCLQAPKGQQLKEAMARLLQENGHQWMKRIHHEGGLCLNCHWQEVDLELSSKVPACMPASHLKSLPPSVYVQRHAIIRHTGIFLQRHT